MAIFEYVDGLENKYLQSVNLDALQKETGLTLQQLAALAKVGPKVIYKWRYLHKDGSRPDYNTIIRLLQKGATVETLFGVDYNGPIKNGFKILPELASKPEFLKGQEEALKDFEERIERRVIEKLKENGIINDQNEKNNFVFDCEKFLERKSWTIENLAEKLEISSATVLNWKNGRSFPKIETLLKLIDLGATIDELFGHDYAMKLASNTSEAYKPEIKKRVSKK